MSILKDNNISVKEYNEINKNNNLEIEIGKMWHLKTTTVPEIVGALGMMKKRQINTLARYLVVLYEIKIGLCKTAHLLRRVLSAWSER